MGYLTRIEAKIEEVDANIILPLKPLKLNNIVTDKKSNNANKKKLDKSKATKKASKIPKKAKAPKAPSAKAAQGKGEEVGFSQLTNTRKLTPFIEHELQLTDPFNFENETWIRFVKKVAPKLLTALLLDMNVVPKARQAEFARYLTKRLRSLAK